MDPDVLGTRDASSHGRSITRAAASRATALPTLLLSAYVAALILFPADFGFRLLGFVLSPARIVLLMLVCIALATGTLSLKLLRSESRAVLLAWGAFLVAALVATMLHPTAGAISRLLSLAAEGLVVYLVTRAAASEPAAIRAVVRVAVYATVVVVLLSLIAGSVGLRYDSILTTLTGGAMPPNLSGNRFGLVRQQGSFPAALFFAIWVAACTALVLPWLRSHERWTVATVSATWALLVFGMAILTVSRIAITGVFVIAGIYLWRWGHRAFGTAALAVGFAVALGFAGLSTGTAPLPTLDPSGSPGISTPSGTPAAQDYPSESDILAGSNELRLRAIQTTMQAVAQEPLFGWGLLRAKDVVTSLGGSTNYVDSSYLVFAVDMGLVGLATFLALVASVFAAGRAGWWSTREGMALGLACVTIVTMSAVAAYLNVTQGYATFWLLAALMVNTGLVAKRAATTD